MDGGSGELAYSLYDNIVPSGKTLDAVTCLATGGALRGAAGVVLTSYRSNTDTTAAAATVGIVPT